VEKQNSYYKDLFESFESGDVNDYSEENDKFADKCGLLYNRPVSDYDNGQFDSSLKYMQILHLSIPSFVHNFLQRSAFDEMTNKHYLNKLLYGSHERLATNFVAVDVDYSSSLHSNLSSFNEQSNTLFVHYLFQRNLLVYEMLHFLSSSIELNKKSAVSSRAALADLTQGEILAVDFRTTYVSKTQSSHNCSRVSEAS